jgi:hypothetical protein
MDFLREVKRRNVHRMAGLYLVGRVAGGADRRDDLSGVRFSPTSPVRIVVIVLAIGFVPALVFSWIFELTPEGLKRENSLDHALAH